MKNPLAIILAAYLLTEAFGYLIEYLNVSRLKRSSNVIPPEFEGKIDFSVRKGARIHVGEYAVLVHRLSFQ